MKTAARAAALLVVGGLAGREVEKRWSPNFQWWKRAQAAEPLMSNRPTEIMKYGFPSNDNLKIRQNYVLSYDKRSRNAHWVFEHLTEKIIDRTEDSVDRVNVPFVEDPSIPKLFRSSNRDYHDSGFDRGHLAAAANHRAHKNWMEDTFYLSNISPQNPHFNRNAWNNLEKYVRSLCFHNDNVYVCTGPLYLPRRWEDGKLYVHYQVLEPNQVAVPTHYFKVVLCEKQGKFELRSYVMPNVQLDPNIPLKDFETPLEAIEKSAGVQIFSALPPNVLKSLMQKQSKRLKA